MGLVGDRAYPRWIGLRKAKLELEPEILNDQQPGIQKVLASGLGRYEIGIGLECGRQIVQVLELDGDELFDCLGSQPNVQMGLDTPGAS